MRNEATVNTCEHQATKARRRGGEGEEKGLRNGVKNSNTA
jgi:hypothetical protein